MKIAVRHVSRSGNTRRIAEAIGRAVGVAAQEASVPLEQKTDIVFLGSALYAGGVDEAIPRFLQDNADKIGILYNFSTAASPSSTFRVVRRLAAERGVRMGTAQFRCPGAFLFLNRGRPNDKDEEAAADFAREAVSRGR